MKSLCDPCHDLRALAGPDKAVTLKFDLLEACIKVSTADICLPFPTASTRLCSVRTLLGVLRILF